MASLNIESKTELRSGHEIPLLGFGVWQTPADEAERCVNEAFKAGYRHIDSAAAYRNEAGCGKAIRVTSTLPRKQIFFTSKVPRASLDYEGAKAQVDKTLAETGLEYIDLMLLHAPYGGSANRKGAWKALVEAVEAGKVRSIGVSNYGVHHLDELEKHIAELEAERGGKGKGGVLSIGQWEIHPWCARNDIAQWCSQRGVAVEAYSPLVRGERWGEPVLKKLAEKYGKSEAQVLIRWSLQKGYIPLPKSVTPERIRANADVFDFELTLEEVNELETDEYKPVCWDPNVSSLED
ncbi:NADP-dependent oxidoreductase domain-containing protein [Diplogelasinospora grovesii]|uniref:NADP-dependent oxidoreductase domain-containing protein n=1 Tax=Diplogelasinospora grovesii TaxID=303347 RepID=A0AAN6NEK2_9PEZI|nr:NADP-dependent oxidoreductase domain-containing protein [Diplogelasinospora grovesii]